MYKIVTTPEELSKQRRAAADSNASNQLTAKEAVLPGWRKLSPSN